MDNNAIIKSKDMCIPTCISNNQPENVYTVITGEIT